MRDLHHYLDQLDTTDTVGRQYLAEAVAVARHGPAQLRETDVDLAAIARELPEISSADDARQRLLVERACAEVANQIDGPGPPSKGRQELADELDVARRTVTSWILGERALSGPARKMVEEIAEVHP